MSVRKNKKILLISNRNNIITEINSIRNKFYKNTDINLSRCIDDSIDEISKNGFDITILDSRIPSNKNIHSKDAIELSISANKNILVICDECNKNQILKDLTVEEKKYVNFIDESSINDNTLLFSIEKCFSLPKRDNRKILKETLKEIEKENHTIFNKYDFLSFV